MVTLGQRVRGRRSSGTDDELREGQVRRLGGGPDEAVVGGREADVESLVTGLAWYGHGHSVRTSATFCFPGPHEEEPGPVITDGYTWLYL